MTQAQGKSRRGWLGARRATVIRLGFGLLPAIGLVDYLTGSDLGLSIFYAMPVAWVAWGAGVGPGGLAAVTGAVVWLAVDLLGGPAYGSPAAPYWNAAVRLGFFLVIGSTLSRLRTVLAERNRLVRDLRRALEERDRAAAQLARSNEDLQEYAYVAAHDLRAPLANIGGFAQLLQRSYSEKLDPRAREMIATIVAQTLRMEALISGLLEYAKLGAGEPAREIVDTGEAVDHALAALEAEAAAQQAVVTHSALPSVPADPVQIERLFQNLLANAIKYRGESSPRVQVDAERRGDVWEFAVRDNGVGIAPEHLEKLFHLFSRVPGTAGRPGAGIGLAGCKKIVERHAGRIWIESAPGRGTTVRFTLPANPEGGATTPTPLDG